ncbi:hypothetical protein QFC22_002088 [Naganishia vaughanmartiniae]|uniref:Uncharacterized protein n=1 Tax=Naganishia vaughanmartiniae TaxID=1424756 RepID=A0ACC2XFI6_9TREE|nr:hypothetical protein QFC22_002088 [Naganishia vaughanmartiniae]
MPGRHAADHKKHTVGTGPLGSTGEGGSGMRRPMDKKRRNKMIASYLADWVLTIFLWVSISSDAGGGANPNEWCVARQAIFYLLDKINGYRRLFSITDKSISYPFAEHERIPVWALALIAGVFPLVVILLTAAFYTRSFYDAQVGALGLALSLGLTVTLTDIIKITVGRPRPDLINRCQPPETYTTNPVHGLTSWHICTRTDLLNDGFRSFPSGHSSFGWCGMVYLALFLAAKMHVLNKRGYTFKSWILLIPIAAASLISVSRTMDYRHHATDVIAGAIIGILMAWYAYRQFYPPLAAERSHRPYSPRIAHEDAHITAEENPELMQVDNMATMHGAPRSGPILPVTKTASSSLSNGAGGSNGAYMRNATSHEPRTSIGDGDQPHYQQQHDDPRFGRDEGGAYYTNATSPLIPAAAPHASHHYHPQSEAAAPGGTPGVPFGYPPTTVSGRGGAGLAEPVEPYAAKDERSRTSGQNGAMFV